MLLRFARHLAFVRFVFPLFGLLLFCGLLLGSSALVVPAAHAAGKTVYVNSTGDSTHSCSSNGTGTCTLRDAINYTNDQSGSDAIFFSVDGIITLASALPMITDPVFISGSGHSIRIDGNYLYRPFIIDGGANVQLDSLIIMNGKAGDYFGGNAGGAIFNYGILTVSSSLLMLNSASSGISNKGYGGAIYNLGYLAVSGSTLTDNTVSKGDGGAIYSDSGTVNVYNSTLSSNFTLGYGDGGGIFNGSGSTLTVANSTLAGNAAINRGGAIATRGTLNVINTTISGNSAAVGGGIDNGGRMNFSNTMIANSTGADCIDFGSIGTNQNNLVGDGLCTTNGVNFKSGDPKLGALTNNGGPTPTMALLAGSPAGNAGDDATCLASPVNGKDQRGVTRPQGTHCDIGAYEQQLPWATTEAATSITSNGATLNGSANSVFGSATVIFEYGTDTSYGSTITAAESPVTGHSDTSVSAALTGLLPNTTYHYRVVATNAGGATDGSDMTFTTSCLSTVTVVSNADSGAGSLRQAIASACDGGTITFGGDYVITLASKLSIAKSLTIDGETHSVTVSGNHAVRVFDIFTGTVTLDTLWITSGKGMDCGGHTCGGGIMNGGVLTVTNSTLLSSSAAYGGGIMNNGGTLNVTGSILSVNSATTYGGGIDNQGGTLNLIDTTLSGNSAPYGGGLYNNGVATVGNSTFAVNSATTYGGGIDNQGGTLTVTNSTLSGNLASIGGGIMNESTLNFSNTIIANSTGGDCANFGTISTNKNNLVQSGACATNGVNFHTGDPRLGALTGTPPYFPPLPGSPAIDAGDDAACAAPPIDNLDQRGVTRPYGAHCDIGAFEYNGTTAVAVSGIKAQVTPKGTVQVKWQTMTESQIAGFDVWRKLGDGTWKKVTNQFIQAKHSGDSAGDKYTFTDKQVQQGKTYRYKIQVTYLDGHTEWTGVKRVKLS